MIFRTFIFLFSFASLAQTSYASSTNLPILGIIYERTGGMLPAPIDDGRRCFEVNTIEILPDQMQRKFWCSANSSSTPNRIVYSRSSTNNLLADTSFILSLSSLLSSLTTKTFSGQSTVSDDVTVELRIQTAFDTHIIKSLRHDSEMDSDYKAVLESIEDAAIKHLPF